MASLAYGHKYYTPLKSILLYPQKKYIKKPFSDINYPIEETFHQHLHVKYISLG
jgi:hypothetical protein